MPSLLEVEGRVKLAPFKKIQKRSGTKFILTLPDDEKFVAMCEFRGSIYVASTKSVYRIKGKKVVKLELYPYGG